MGICGILYYIPNLHYSYFNIYISICCTFLTHKITSRSRRGADRRFAYVSLSLLLKISLTCRRLFYERVISVHSSITYFLLAHLILFPENPYLIFSVEVGPY